jgi:hypothetical protein
MRSAIDFVGKSGERIPEIPHPYQEKRCIGYE